MKGAVPVVVITVLVLSALSTSHPYYPSPRLNGNSVDMQSGKDLPRRPLASWQEYAAGLMQGKKPTDPPADPRPTDTLSKITESTANALDLLAKLDYMQILSINEFSNQFIILIIKLA